MADSHTLEVLDYPTILRMLSERASTPLGREEALSIEPLTDLEDIERLLDETSEAREFLAGRGHPPFTGVEDIRPVLERASLEGTLEPEELLSVASTVEAAEEVKRALLKASREFPLLAEHAKRMPSALSLARAIRRAISERGEVRDEASEELRRIRAEIRRLRAEITGALEEAINSPEVRGALQEPLIVVRHGRYCLPVRSELRHKVGGVILGRSGSKATLFIEPEWVVERNNRLQELLSEEEAEVGRILRRLTALVAGRRKDLDLMLREVRHLDLTFAKAKLAEDMGATRPAIVKGGGRRFKLLRARHPLIPRDRVVPIDVWAGEGFRVLVITGPNTGGKTVTLKTVGLLVLMAQSGLHIPASTDSEISVFRRIFADIGEEQSVEQSLSTFSSHLRHILRALRGADRGSLVLLDELGAGTDPAEGSALARAIVEELLRRGCVALVTTHIGSLKVFAHLTEGCENACLLFDPETLRPTYELVIGQPGSSYALEVAERLGMPPHLVGRARELVEEGRSEPERALERLRREAEELARKAQEIRAREEELERKERELEERMREAEAEMAERLRRAVEEAREIVKRAEREAKEILRELRGKTKEGKETEELRARLREMRDSLSRWLEAQAREAKIEPSKVEAGGWVRLKGTRRAGLVVSVDEVRGVAEVLLGRARLKWPLSELEPVPPPEGAEAKAPEIPGVEVRDEVNLRGMGREEALAELERFLEEAKAMGLKVVRVVHGKGEGILRQAVHEYLRGRKDVKSFRLAPPAGGGAGVTIVEFE